MDPLMDVIKNSEEPDWLEKPVAGELRIWHIVFLCVGSFTTLIVVVCCCFRFRIPRTKQQIEADYQRRKITSKFRQQLETIQDAKMDAMSLTDALELFHGKTAHMDGTEENQAGSQDSSMVSPQQSSLEASIQQDGRKDQQSGVSFAKLAGKVAHINKLGQTKETTTAESPAKNGGMNF